MNWRDFLLLATRLAAEGTEADWRTAVSRAYYAAFHIARRLLADLQFTVPRADRAHQYLVYRLGIGQFTRRPRGQAIGKETGRHLHLDVQLPTALVAGFDVQNRRFAVQLDRDRIPRFDDLEPRSLTAHRKLWKRFA